MADWSLPFKTPQKVQAWQGKGRVEDLAAKDSHKRYRSCPQAIPEPSKQVKHLMQFSAFTFGVQVPIRLYYSLKPYLVRSFVLVKALSYVSPLGSK